MNNTLDIDALVARIKAVLPESSEPIALHEPRFQGNEWAYVKDCIDTGWVSTVGTYVNRFEQSLSEYTGAKHAIAVVNGTAALHICLLLVGVERGDEVVVPSLTFVATANAISYCGAVPLFADSDQATLGMSAAKVDEFLVNHAEVRGGVCFNRQTGRRIAALMPMHTFGQPVDIDAFLALADKWKLPLIEDAAESLGTSYRGVHTGNFGIVSALSFNGNKIITTGGGGAILTNNEALAKRAKHLTTTARVPHKWSFVHDEVGYNYRLPNINAALGCAQMELLPEFLERKRQLAARYEKALKDVAGLRFFVERDEVHSNYWLNTILLDQQSMEHRDHVLEKLNISGLMARPAWVLMHKLPIFAEAPRMDLSVAEALEKNIINIPSRGILS